MSPELADDTDGTIAEATRLWSALDRPNAMIKIPGHHRRAFGAIEDSLAAGISINVTLLFSVRRYDEVIEAFLSGLERRKAQGSRSTAITSVASFFVSRVDGRDRSALDRQATRRSSAAPSRSPTPAWPTPRSSAPATRRGGRRWPPPGRAPQRPLWASTSTKDPKYPDIYYIEALIGADTVNTIPPDTFDAYRDHGKPEPRIAAAIETAPARLAALASMGIDLDEITRFLEEDGVTKFAASYRQLLAGIDAKAHALAER